MLETRLCLHVEQFDESREFYENVLQWKIYSEWNRGESHQGIIYEFNGSYLELTSATEMNQTDFSSSFYWYVEVSDIEKIIFDLQNKGCELIDIQITQWKHKHCSVHDPNGFQIKFFQKL